MMKTPAKSLKRGAGRAAALGRRAARITTLAAASLLALACGLGGAVTGPDVAAAPNPLRTNSFSHLVTVAADGTYEVSMTETIDLALETSWWFGDTIHDGFRLPDTEALLPPYLRAEYSHPRGSIDGTSAEASIEREVHAVDIGFETEKLEPGVHKGVLDYQVSGAAVPSDMVAGDGAEGSDGGVTVYFRPLRPGDLLIESEAPIADVACESWPGQATPCGKRDAEAWTVPAEALGRSTPSDTSVVRITIDTDEQSAQPVVDTDR
jgi:hypothetical protein